jgi:hypothetical protein
MPLRRPASDPRAGADAVERRPAGRASRAGEDRPAATGYDPAMKVRTWHVDAALCTLFALAGAWMSWVARAAAADAVRRYGHNVDSGVLEYAAAVFFLLPVALLFAAAAIAGARGWRLGRGMHWLAVAAAVAPIACAIVAAVSR